MSAASRCRSPSAWLAVRNDPSIRALQARVEGVSAILARRLRHAADPIERAELDFAAAECRAIHAALAEHGYGAGLGIY